MPRFSDYTPDERVIDRVVSLWIGALRDPKYDNGDTTGGSAISAAVVSCRSKNNDDATLARFGAELKKRLMNQFTTPPSREGGEPYTRWITSLGVDYGPDAVLSEAAKAAGLKMEFPWKTRMSFSTDNVNFREGYGALDVFHYPMPEGGWLTTTLSGSKEDVAALVRYAADAQQGDFFRIER
jgi:hypothetical protein